MSHYLTNFLSYTLCYLLYEKLLFLLIFNIPVYMFTHFQYSRVHVLETLALLRG